MSICYTVALVKRYGQLSTAQQARVQNLLTRSLSACRRNGIPLTAEERGAHFRDAVEIVAAGLDEDLESYHEPEPPFVKLHQYVRPLHDMDGDHPLTINERARLKMAAKRAQASKAKVVEIEVMND